jgi:hypothetical protein
MVGIALAADAPQEITIPALVGIQRNTITAYKNSLIKSNNRNKLVRAGCWTVGGIVALAACYTTLKDCSWFHKDPTDALEQATRTAQEHLARESKIVEFLGDKLWPAIKESLPEEKQLDLGSQLAALVNEVKLKEIIEFKPVPEGFFRRLYNAAFYPVIFGAVTFILKVVFQDQTVQAFVKGRSTFDAVCKNIDQIGYAVNAIKAAPHVYTEQRLDMVQASAVHAYNNFMRDIERVLGYMEFQVRYHDLKEHATQTDVDFVTFITNDFERSAQQAEDIAARYVAAENNSEQKIAQLVALHEHLMLYKNMFKLLLDNFERYEEQVALAL